MRIFGYDNNDLEFAKIIELSQATLTCKKHDLDKIIEFLMEVKKEIDNSKTEMEIIGIIEIIIMIGRKKSQI